MDAGPRRHGSQHAPPNPQLGGGVPPQLLRPEEGRGSSLAHLLRLPLHGAVPKRLRRRADLQRARPAKAAGKQEESRRPGQRLPGHRLHRRGDRGVRG